MKKQTRKRCASYVGEVFHEEWKKTNKFCPQYWKAKKRKTSKTAKGRWKKREKNRWANSTSKERGSINLCKLNNNQLPLFFSRGNLNTGQAACRSMKKLKWKNTRKNIEKSAKKIHEIWSLNNSWDELSKTKYGNL